MILEIDARGNQGECLKRLVELADERGWRVTLDGSKFLIHAQAGRDGPFAPMLVGTVTGSATGSRVSARLARASMGQVVVGLGIVAGLFGLVGGTAQLVGVVRSNGAAFDIGRHAIQALVGLTLLAASLVFYRIGTKAARDRSIELVAAVRDRLRT